MRIHWLVVWGPVFWIGEVVRIRGIPVKGFRKQIVYVIKGGITISGILQYHGIESIIVQPIGSMYAIYGNIDHQYTPVMLAYIPHMDPMGNITGWWFGCHELCFPINIGFLIIPIDFHIFQRGSNHQPG